MCRLKRAHAAALVILMLVLTGSRAQAQAPQDLLATPDNHPIHGMTWPSISPDGSRLCFTYLGDLWTVPANGGTATRLTIHEALDASSRWSPDGKWIAFTSTRNGNADVFIIPSEGGDAREVTFHSGNDWLCDWAPDGKSLVFYSIRDTRTFSLYSVDLTTHAVKQLTKEIQDADRFAAWSPDGGTIAYTRGGQPWWRPWYKGSVAARTCLLNLKSGDIRYLVKTDSQQFWPLFSADGKFVYVTCIYGKGSTTPNIFRVPTDGGAPVAITHYATDAVRYPAISHNGAKLVYLWNGDLYTTTADGKDVRKIDIAAHSDDKINNQQRVHLTQEATELEISPNGKQIALVLRGTLWTMPIAGGDAQRLTKEEESDGDIIWSPDNSKLAFISDRGARTDLYSIDVNTKAITRITDDPDTKSNPTWSPDGKWIAYAKAGAEAGLYVVSSVGGTPRRLAAGNGDNQFGIGVTSHCWSPDSRWIAFSRMDRLENRDLWIVPVVGGAPINVTRYPGNNVGPLFTSDGRRLLFISDRNGPPLLFQITLLPDEEAAMAMAAEEDHEHPPKAPDHSKNVQIDFVDIHLRARQVIPPLGALEDYQPTPDGKRVLVHIGNMFWVGPITGGPALQLAGDEEEGGLRILPDGSRFFYIGAGGTVRSQPLAPGGSASTVAFSADLSFDRRAQYRHAFNEFYRRFGAAFYDSKLHGANWRALRDHYEPFLEAVGTPEEFAMVLWQMVGTVNSSHSEIAPAPGPPGPQTASLGLFFDDNYSGPGLKVAAVLPKGPADRAISRVSAGEYILSIDSTDVKMTEDFYKLLQDKAGKTVTLQVNSTPVKEGARTVKIRPITSAIWSNLQYEADVVHDRELVNTLSDGKLAYIRIKQMDQPSLRQFERELWGDAQDKQGLILDVRENGGGNTHDAVLTDLERRVYGYTTPRDGERQSQPQKAWTHPIVLLADQNSYSDAELLAAGFRALKLGKIVGVPTPGYVIGTYEARLIDGTTFRLPSWGFTTVDGKNLENMGVAPDIYVENSPNDVAKGVDRQLYTAVETAMKDVATAPKGN
jgi:Tol biopolymer transport system component/C-terminal processing protease CtpA/Prc